MRRPWPPSRPASSARPPRILGRLVNAHPDDGPSFALLARAIAYIVDEPENFDPAFRLAGK